MAYSTTPSRHGGFARSKAEAAFPQLWEGLVSAWSVPLHHQGGTTFRDVSQKRNHGTLNNMEVTDWKIYKGAPGLDFGGTNEYVDCSLAGSPVKSGRITVCAWLTPQVTTRGDIVTCWDDGLLGGEAKNQFNLLYGLTSGKPQFYISSGTTRPDSGVGATAMTSGTMYFLCGRYDNVAITVWLNGKQEASAASTITLGSGSTQSIRLGDNKKPDGPLTGIIHEALLYDRALSAQEILRLCRLGPGGFATPKGRFRGMVPVAPAAQNNAAWWLAYQMGM